MGRGPLECAFIMHGADDADGDIEADQEQTGSDYGETENCNDYRGTDEGFDGTTWDTLNGHNDNWSPACDILTF